MKQDDIFQLIGVIGKLNLTIDQQADQIKAQEQLLKEYFDVHGPLDTELGKQYAAQIPAPVEKSLDEKTSNVESADQHL